MSNNFELRILLPSVFLCLFQVALAIKCWECRSDIDPSCGDPFNNVTLPITDCNWRGSPPHLPDAKATMCRTIHQKIYNVSRYIRGCAFLGGASVESDEPDCYTRNVTYEVFAEYCSCFTDGCNH